MTDISLGRLMATLDMEFPVDTILDNGRITVAPLDVCEINAIIAGVALEVARDRDENTDPGLTIEPSVLETPEEELAALGREQNADLTTVVALYEDAIDIDIR